MTSRSAAAALERLPRGARIVAGPGCGTPETLLRALGEHAASMAGPTLYSGLQLGAYPFLDAVAAGTLRFATWHVMGPVRDLVATGAVDYLPIRASEVPRLLGHWDVDVAFVRVSPPDRNGYVSLGPSVSYPGPAVRQARLVVGEVDPTLPRTHGASHVHVSQFDSLVDTEDATCTYTSGTPSDLSRQIADHVLELLPDRPALQVGIGEIPEALVAALPDAGLGPVRFVGMATDAMVDLFDDGTVDPRAVVPDPALATVELMGSRRLLDAADDHPAIGVYPSDRFHAPRHLAEIPRLVSLNSAIEVDLTGQCNAETIGTRQVSGVGGSMDFVEGAFTSDGGLRILALPSTTRDGTRTRIVSRLAHGAATTVPRHTTDLVVTEHGVADLRGRSTRERAAALIAVAHPDHRDELADQSPIQSRSDR